MLKRLWGKGCSSLYFFCHISNNNKKPFQNERALFKMKGFSYLLMWYSSIFRYKVVKPIFSKRAASVLLPFATLSTF